MNRDDENFETKQSENVDHSFVSGRDHRVAPSSSSASYINHIPHLVPISSGSSQGAKRSLEMKILVCNLFWGLELSTTTDLYRIMMMIPIGLCLFGCGESLGSIGRRS